MLTQAAHLCDRRITKGRQVALRPTKGEDYRLNADRMDEEFAWRA
jgi:hypothetical protein